MRRRTLVLLSGGLDSTTAAVKLLRETDDDLHLHFIDFRTDRHRHRAEAVAVARLLPHLRAIRSFAFSSTQQDYSRLGSPVDLHMYCFTAAQLVRMLRNWKVDRIATGLMRGDRDVAWEHRRRVANAIFDACLADLPPDDRPTWFFPCLDLSKAEEMAYIGVELFRLTWSCRRPIEAGDSFARCGTCGTCRQIAFAEVETGLTHAH
jgi:7-cyano-7-deazaguanine synthase in queuosine biosynthesis